jgi:hypothetical protein
MLVMSEKEDERTKVKQILKNHGLDDIVTNSVTKNLFYELQIQKKKY